MANYKKIPEDLPETSTTKYMIYAYFNVDGVVEKPDVVGALFGQTEGLLSDDLDLRELQKGRRVGRIHVRLSIRGNRTKGTLKIPSSLDKVETSILAAAIETVDRVGPCNASIKIKKIEDVREEKRQQIIERATNLLKKWDAQISSETSEIADEVMKAAKIGGISHYGKLPAGPGLNDSDTIIIVEGRADIAACLRAGVRNTIAVQGSRVPRSVSNLTKKRTSIAFLDGDRGGDLILKELLMYSDIDYVARAPLGKEVEDLKPSEILEQLKNKIPLEEANFVSDIHASQLLQKAIIRKQKKTDIKPTKPTPKSTKPLESEIKKKIESKVSTTTKKEKPKATKSKPSKPQKQTTSKSTKKAPQKSYSKKQSKSHSRSRKKSYQRFPLRLPDEMKDLVKKIENGDKQEGLFLNDKMKEIKRLSVESIYQELEKTRKKVDKIVFDGIITQRMIDLCEKKNVSDLIGAKISDIENKPKKTKVYTFA